MCFAFTPSATPAMTEDTPLPFDLPAVARKKLTVGFDGGQLSSNGGLLLLREAERKLAIADRFAAAMRDRRDPTRISHPMSELIKTRALAICCGHVDANDLNRLRHDPLLKLAVGRCPETGEVLCSQSTMSRLENMPTKIEAARLTAALVDQFCASFDAPPEEITLDIDDTVDEVHGGQQLSFWNAHYDCRCFLPMHVYHVESGKPVVVILREGKTPNGVEVRTVIKHLVKRIRRHWPSTRIRFRGDSHYGRAEAIEWAEGNGVGYIFGFPGNAKLDALVAETADHLRFWHALGSEEKLRTFVSFEYQAKSWSKPRRIVARLEASLQPDVGGMRQEVDIRYVVTSMEGSAQHLYETVYCARGQAENLIKLHKAQLASDRTSCHSAVANQVRLVLHTVAYWLIHTLRDAMPKTSPLAKAEFATIRSKLIKIAARIVEHASRIRVFLPTGCPDQALFKATAEGLMPAGP
jgi:hypothetical protein